MSPKSRNNYLHRKIVTNITVTINCKYKNKVKYFYLWMFYGSFKKKFEIYIWWKSGVHEPSTSPVDESVVPLWNELFPFYIQSALFTSIYYVDSVLSRLVINTVSTLDYDFDHLDHSIQEMLYKQPVLGDIPVLHFRFSAYIPKIFILKPIQQYFGTVIHRDFWKWHPKTSQLGIPYTKIKFIYPRLIWNVLHIICGIYLLWYYGGLAYIERGFYILIF